MGMRWLLSLVVLAACATKEQQGTGQVDQSMSAMPSPAAPAGAGMEAAPAGTQQQGPTGSGSGAFASMPGSTSQLPAAGSSADAPVPGNGVAPPAPGTGSDGDGMTPGNGDAPMTGGSDASNPGDGDAPIDGPADCPENMEQTPEDADPCTAPLRPGDDRLCEFTYSGERRKFFVYAPPSFNVCEPASLVLDMHGASESIEVHIGIETFSGSQNPLGYGSSWRRAIQGDNVVVVTPEGIDLRWSRANDPGFLNEVADMVEAMAEVDPEKRYLTGISMGGMITVATGCEDTNRWRGMAPIAMLTNSCRSVDRPIPHIAFHATGDSLTSYSDDRDLAEQMAANNNCDSTADTVYYGGPNTSDEPVCFEEPYGPGSPEPDDPYAVPIAACPSDRPESSCQVWRGCDEDVEVRFCTVEAGTQRLGGHLLYTNDTALHLARMSWLFFKSFWK
ncbi:MAG: hypothetical protein OXU20_06735 [Myxococcales bacterium]|nr:hypothetical protein [Myxococcales bacterium]